MTEIGSQINIEQKKDLLNRESFVNQVIEIIEEFAKQKKNSCFAINGQWGVGKSFVIEMLEEKIRNIQQTANVTDKYLIFRYNCWKYDFYEEPVVAIVATIIDEIDRNVQLISTEKQELVKGILKAVGTTLLTNFNEAIKEKTNIDIKEIFEIIESGKENVARKLEREQDYDTYFAFKKTLTRLQKTITSLSKDQTVIFVVDEMDRCLPEYMIKVLERLHHVFHEIPNVQVILAIDKEQIQHTIRKIYGASINVNKYLAKFIEFELNLEIGTLIDEYTETYSYYFNKFESICDGTHPIDAHEFHKNILQGIDMRSRIEIINKCNLLHNILGSELKSDYAVMCLELFFCVLKYWDVDIMESRRNYNLQSPFTYPKTNVENGLKYLVEKFSQARNNGVWFHVTENGSDYVRQSEIFSLVLSCYRYILGFSNDIITHDLYSGSKMREYSKKYWELLKIIN